MPFKIAGQMLFGCFHSAGECRGSNLWAVGFSVVSVDQLANLHSVSLRYLVTFRVNVRRKKNDGDTPSIILGKDF